MASAQDLAALGGTPVRRPNAAPASTLRDGRCVGMFGFPPANRTAYWCKRSSATLASWTKSSTHVMPSFAAAEGVDGAVAELMLLVLADMDEAAGGGMGEDDGDTDPGVADPPLLEAESNARKYPSSSLLAVLFLEVAGRHPPGTKLSDARIGYHGVASMAAAAPSFPPLLPPPPLMSLLASRSWWRPIRRRLFGSILPSFCSCQLASLNGALRC
mmetsp:Transcript_26458/g.74023  ORF Transcript_26458/g.74023 Transcript_26458/m.74023 type:complete len:215 (-) Transcript_26458:432-1076(-)